MASRRPSSRACASYSFMVSSSRARDTAATLAKGVAENGGQVVGPRVAFALRNDLI